MKEWDRAGQLWALDYLEATAQDEPGEARLSQHALLLQLRDLDGKLDEDAVMQLLFGMANVADWALRALASHLSGGQVSDTKVVIAEVRSRVQGAE